MRRVPLSRLPAITRRPDSPVHKRRIPSKPFWQRSFSIDHALLILGGVFFGLLSVGLYSLVGISSDEIIHSAAARNALLEERKRAAEKPSTTDPYGIETKGRTPADIAAAIDTVVAHTYLHIGDSRPIIFVLDSGRGRRTLSAGEMLEKIAPSAPDELIRALKDDPATYMLLKGKRLHATLLLPVASYTYAAAGMRQFENGMADDILPFLTPERSAPSIHEISRHPFHDERIGDIDTRVLLDAGDEIALIYGFVGTTSIAIATDETDFQEITSSGAGEGGK